jgi:tripartite-type tricarboxylate transporter receptor subunit TctC
MPNGFALDAWLALVAPAGTPPAIVARLYAVLVDGLKDPAFRSSLDGDGSEVVFNSPAEFAALLKDETVKWQALITRVGVKLD